MPTLAYRHIFLTAQREKHEKFKPYFLKHIPEQKYLIGFIKSLATALHLKPHRIFRMAQPAASQPPQP